MKTLLWRLARWTRTCCAATAPASYPTGMRCSLPPRHGPYHAGTHGRDTHMWPGHPAGTRR